MTHRPRTPTPPSDAAPDLDDEQRHYLAEGLRHRARYYGTDIGEPPGGHLSLALAWWANWWQARADNAQIRDARQRGGEDDLFPEIRRAVQAAASLRARPPPSPLSPKPPRPPVS